MIVFGGGGLRCGKCYWVRLWSNGPGLQITSAPPLFSERYGYTKSMPVGFGYRIKYLPRWRQK